MLFEGLTLDGVNDVLQEVGASTLDKIEAIDDQLYIVRVKNGPNVLVSIDTPYAAEQIERGAPVERIFVTILFATLYAAVEVDGYGIDPVTGSPYFGRQYLPPSPYPPQDLT